MSKQLSHYGATLTGESAIKRSCIYPTLESTGYFKKDEFKNFQADLVVGIGGMRNLDIAAVQESKDLILCDFNESLCEFWEMFGKNISESQSKQDFLQSLKDDMIKNRSVCANSADHPDLRPDYLLFGRDMSSQELEETQKDNIDRYIGLLADELTDKISRMTWFEDKNFHHIQNLFKQGYQRTDPPSIKELGSEEIEEEKISGQNNCKVLISKIDLTKQNDLDFLQSLIQTKKDNGSEKLVFNFLNCLDFILARENRSFGANKEYTSHDIEDQEFKKLVLDNKSKIKNLASFIQENYQSETQGSNAMILDAFFTKNDRQNRGKYHTNALTPEEFISCRDLESDNIGFISCRAGISPSSSFQVNLHDEKSPMIRRFKDIASGLFSSNSSKQSR